jgi:hypothetical protein
MFQTRLLMTLALAAGAIANAQTPWSANASTAVPLFPSNGVITTETVDGNVHGRGVRPRASVAQPVLGSYLYIPVTAPHKSIMACIAVRADDPVGGKVTAELFRQPRNNVSAGALPALGSVSTGVGGFQFKSSAFAAVAIDYQSFTYYIRLTLIGAAASTATQPITFDVSLTQNCG